MTSIVVYITVEVPIFVGQSAPTITHAPNAMEVTHVVPALRHAECLPITSHSLHTPLRPQVIARFLSTHQDPIFVSELIHSLPDGFNIGYQGPHTCITLPNLTSSSEHPEVVDEALSKEIAENRMAGPYDTPPYTNLRCSGVGVVPKKDGGWRLINHLSAPPDYSINDFIDPEEFSLQYATIDDAIRICHSQGKGALMAKEDLKNAFRLCPVRQEDWHLLGIHWRGKYYIDKCLPFGLRSAPYLFNMVADALEWTLRHHFYINHLFHYLDDFFLVARASSSDCLNGLLDTLFLCRTVGAPVKPEKVLGPSTTLTVLDIELDTNLMQARLPQDKLAALREELSHFKLLHASCLRCTKRQLLSLIGKLTFACKVIPAGRIFLR